MNPDRNAILIKEEETPETELPLSHFLSVCMETRPCEAHGGTKRSCASPGPDNAGPLISDFQPPDL